VGAGHSTFKASAHQSVEAKARLKMRNLSDVTEGIVGLQEGLLQKPRMLL
jgi:hypothetical protein